MYPFSDFLFQLFFLISESYIRFFSNLLAYRSYFEALSLNILNTVILHFSICSLISLSAISYFLLFLIHGILFLGVCVLVLT